MIEEAGIPPEATREQPNYAKGLAWTVGLNAIVKIVFGLVALLIGRKLGPGPMGLYGLLLNIYTFAEQMREAGLKQAYYVDNEITPTKFRTYARLSLISGITFGSILALLSYPLAYFFDQPQLMWSVGWAALATFLNGLSVIPLAAMNKVGRFRDVGLIEVAAGGVSIATAVILIVEGWTFGALVAQLVVRAGVQCILAYWQNPVSVRDHDRAAAKSILKVCTPLVGTDILWLFYSLLDQFTIAKVLGIHYGVSVAFTANGYYQQGRRVLDIPTQLFFQPLFRTVAVAIGNRSENREHLAATFMKAISLAVLVLAGIFGVTAALAKPAVLVILGDKYLGTIPILGIICLGEAFKLTGGFAGSALVAAGKSKIPLYSWLLPYPVLAGGVLLTWNYVSLATIAWSYAAGLIVVNSFVIGAAFRHLKVQKKQVLTFWISVACALSISGIAYGISLLPLGPWPLVLLSLAVIPPIYAVIIGTVLARKPLAFLSRSGPSRLREAL